MIGGNILSMLNLLTLANDKTKIIACQNVPFVNDLYATTGSITSNPFYHR